MNVKSYEFTWRCRIKRWRIFLANPRQYRTIHSLAKLHMNTIEAERGSKTAEKSGCGGIVSKSLDDLRDVSNSLTLQDIRERGS